MTRRVVQDEQGVALVLALMAMVVLSILTAGLLTVVAVNHRTTLRSTEARKAFGIAETGLAYAEGNVYGAAAAHSAPATGQTSFNQDGGAGLYWATVSGDGHTWTMHGQGTYGGVTREVSAQADVPSPVTVSESGVWNYLYADSTNGACPTTISGSTTVAVPTFTRGNLCLQAPFTGSQLEVGGNLMLSGGKAAVGTSSSPVATLAVAGTCSGVTVGTGVCNGSTSPIYAKTTSSKLGVNPGMPPVNLSNSYATANPGPGAGHGCQTGSGTPNPFFDNDTTLNNSVPSINLFPSTAYDCVNGTNEIKWTPTITAACLSGSCLYVNGEFFFDGSLSMAGNTHVFYTGQGTLYFTGSIVSSGNFSICGIQDCSTAWNPDKNGIILLAGCWNNSTGSQLVSLATTGSYCVDYGGTNNIQVGTYCATDYHISGNTTNMGPVLANTLALNGNLSTLVPFHIMPPGTPLNTSTSYLPASAPTYWNG